MNFQVQRNYIYIRSSSLQPTYTRFKHMPIEREQLEAEAHLHSQGQEYLQDCNI